MFKIRELTDIELLVIYGGGNHNDRVHIGALLAAIIISAITGGIVGVGYVLSAAILAKGVDNLTDLAYDELNDN